ncbi:MAG: PilX N-terminal domain-containing pilus assembly protein [Duganella sp.]
MAARCGVGRERGVALLVCLLMLILVMLLGVSAAQLSLQGEKAARGERDRDVAFQAAEDALVDAERDIQQGTAKVVDPACGEAPVWQRVDLSGAADGGACTTEYGVATGAAMQTGQGFLPFKKPRYLIERTECRQPGEDASAGTATSYCYRVTVIGFGAKRATQVVLQSVFIKPEQ